MTDCKEHLAGATDQQVSIMVPVVPGAPDPTAGVVASAEGPASRIRILVTEAAERGVPMASALAVQARLFSVYDEAATVPEALELVQRHLRLTLDRTWFSEQELDRLADELDRLLELGSIAHGIDEVVPPEDDSASEREASALGAAAGSPAG